MLPHFLANLLLVKIDRLSPVNQPHQSSHKLMSLLGRQLKILLILLGNRGDSMQRHCQLTMPYQSRILQNFLDIFFPGCLDQNIQYLPIHIVSIKYIQKRMNNYPEREPRINIHYNGHEKSSFIGSNSQVGLPSSKISTVQINNQQYVPKIIQSGYIVGPPVAYSKDPHLPGHYNAFSPSNKNSSIIIQSTSNSQIHRDYSPHRSRSITPNKSFVNAHPSFQFTNAESTVSHAPSVVVRPPSHLVREETVSRASYDHCVTECKNWETKYNELYLKFMNQSNQNNSEQVSRLRQQNYGMKRRIRELESQQNNSEQTANVMKDVIDRHKESTLKEMYLLVDRYRLECKQNGR